MLILIESAGIGKIAAVEEDIAGWVRGCVDAGDVSMLTFGRGPSGHT